MQRLITLLLTTVALAHTSSAIASTTVALSVTPQLQAQLVELYSKGDCHEIISRTSPRTLPLLSPNVMAIVASCDPPWESSEAMFKEAERRMPTGDLILVLHAKYRTQKDPKSAEPLWRKILLIARNEAFIEMASEYFAGKYARLKGPINLNSTTIFGSLLIGAGEESSARPNEFAYLTSHGTGATYLKGDVSWRQWTPWGSIANHLDFAANHYFSESQFTSQAIGLHIPIAFHVASTKDIVLQPLFGTSRIGGQRYRSLYGLGVLGVVYRNGYRQSVQGLVFQDQIGISELSNSDGAHYRFEYNWEFFRELQYFSLLLAIEHVSSGHSSEFNQVSGYFPWSHTEIDSNFKIEQNLRSFSVGLVPQFAYRLDTEESTYPARNTGATTSVRRADWSLSLRPYVSIPLLPQTQLLAWYSYERVFSNIGENDYANRNQSNHVGALALKVALSTY